MMCQAQASQNNPSGVGPIITMELTDKGRHNSHNHNNQSVCYLISNH